MQPQAHLKKVSVPWLAFSIFSHSVAAPPREVDPTTAVVVRRSGGAGDPVPRDGVVSFEAELVDASGDRIPGVMFSWAVEPVTGNATVLRETTARSGEFAELQNRYAYNLLTDTWGVQPGNIFLRATAVYNGQPLTAQSDSVVLGGP